MARLRENKILVILPTYNEALNIEDVLTKLRNVLPNCMILVVDDGSPDGTADLVTGLAKIVGNLEVLKRGEKSGLGSACIAGFKWGLNRGYDIVIEMDSDLSHDPAEILNIISPLSEEMDLVLGSRYVDGGTIVKWSFFRRLLSRYGNVYVKFMLGVPIMDATTGYRAYSARILKAIDLDSIKANGYGFQIEMVYRTHQLGGKMTEVPIAFVDRKRGNSKMSLTIPIEALLLVTKWSLERILLSRKSKATLT